MEMLLPLPVSVAESPWCPAESVVEAIAVPVFEKVPPALLQVVLVHGSCYPIHVRRDSSVDFWSAVKARPEKIIELFRKETCYDASASLPKI